MRITVGSLRWTVALGVALGVGACEGSDRRLDRLAVGMGKDSVTAAMEGATPQRLDPYLYRGQYIEVLFYPRKGKTTAEDLTDRKMSPVVMIDGKVVGWGWTYWDSAAAANNITVPTK